MRQQKQQSYPLGFRLANRLYKKNFGLYRRFYFLYKRLSDRQSIALMRERIRPGMTVLDIGGNIGFYTLLFSELAGDGGRVHVFEPEENNFRHLQSCAGSLTNVSLNRMAVAQESGRRRLYLSEEMNVDHQIYDIGEGRQWVETESVAIDDYFRNGETIDFIKIDVQGYDYYAAMGMRETVARSASVTLVGELWPYALKKAGVEPARYIKLLRDLGFEMDIPDEDNVVSKTDDKLFYTSFFAYKGGTGRAYGAVSG